MQNSNKMKYIVIIPARFASSRFPGKPLAILGNKPVIQHVYEKANAVLDEVFVATDDINIFDKVKKFGGNVIMTSTDHKSGTDRIKEAAEILEKQGVKFDIVINIQGDEPFVQESQIRSLCKLFEDSTTQIATLGKQFTTMKEVENENSPKIVVDKNGFAMYFSRSVIPFLRGINRTEWIQKYPFLKHIGIYAYRYEILKEITTLPQSPLEIAECLEQLRWLQNGYKIKVGRTDVETIGIDTPEDLKRAEEILKKHIYN